MSAQPAQEPEGKPVLRLCLDLNIWCASALADSFGRLDSASQVLVEAVRRGSCALGPTQLVISWEMINRLAVVFARELVFARLDAETVLDEIVLAANIGPAGLDPLLILGGTGALPLRDEEDRHVLEVAHAGHARILATANFRDFVDYRTEVVKPTRIAIHRTSEHEVIIAHPAEAAAWIRTGEIVLR